MREARSLPGEPLAGPALETIKLQNGGLLLGVDPGVRYHASTQRLRHGDVIVCDTDGAKEAMNRNDDVTLIVGRLSSALLHSAA